MQIKCSYLNDKTLVVLFYSTNRFVICSQIPLWFLPSSPCSISTWISVLQMWVSSLPFAQKFILEDGEKVSDWKYIQFLRGRKEKHNSETLNYSTSKSLI